MADVLSQLLELHAVIESGLNSRLSELVDKEAEAQRVIQQCFDARKQIERERVSLKDAERIYRDAFTAGGNAPARSASDGKVVWQSKQPASSPSSADAETTALQARARIGPQRFLMLDAIDTMSNLTIDDIASLTKLPARRVRDQMVSDLKLGVVSVIDGMYRLTPGGLDLLERFKAYKKAAGQPLPIAGDPAIADDESEGENGTATTTVGVHSPMPLAGWGPPRRSFDDGESDG